MKKKNKKKKIEIEKKSYTTIQISDEIWKKLNEYRQKGESFNDAIIKLFELIRILKEKK